MKKRLNREKQPNFKVKDNKEKEVIINQTKLKRKRLTKLKQEKQREKQT